MARTALQAIDRALGDLKDPDGVTWPKSPFMLDRVGDGLIVIVTLVPAAYQVRELLTITAGESVQELPAEVVRLIRPVRNMGATGDAPGRRITMADEAQMDAVAPDWHAAPERDHVKHVIYDERAPRFFYIYPRVEAQTQIEVITSRVPPAPQNLNSQLPIGDEYFPALVEYLKFRAYDMQGERRDVQRADEAKQEMLNLLNVKEAKDAVLSPDRKVLE